MLCALTQILAVLLIAIVVIELRDRGQAIIYCRYRLWKGDICAVAAVYFKREIELIKKSDFLDNSRIKIFCSRWRALPREEKNAYFDSLY